MYQSQDMFPAASLYPPGPGGGQRQFIPQVPVGPGHALGGGSADQARPAVGLQYPQPYVRQEQAEPKPQWLKSSAVLWGCLALVTVLMLYYLYSEAQKHKRQLQVLNAKCAVALTQADLPALRTVADTLAARDSEMQQQVHGWHGELAATGDRISALRADADALARDYRGLHDSLLGRAQPKPGGPPVAVVPSPPPPTLPVRPTVSPVPRPAAPQPPRAAPAAPHAPVNLFGPNAPAPFVAPPPNTTPPMYQHDPYQYDKDNKPPAPAAGGTRPPLAQAAAPPKPAAPAAVPAAPTGSDARRVYEPTPLAAPLPAEAVPRDLKLADHLHAPPVPVPAPAPAPRQADRTEGEAVPRLPLRRPTDSAPFTPNLFSDVLGGVAQAPRRGS